MRKLLNKIRQYFTTTIVIQIDNPEHIQKLREARVHLHAMVAVAELNFRAECRPEITAAREFLDS